MRSQLLSTLCLSLCLPVAFASAQDSTAAAGKSVWQGVYTDAQAARGESEQQNNCAACHGTEKYSGEAFTKAWIGRTAFDLFDQIKTTMPDDNPGGLSVQQYTDVVAYIFKINGMPAGTQALPADPEALRLIKIEAKPSSPGLAAGRVARRGGPFAVASVRAFGAYHPHAARARSAQR